MNPRRSISRFSLLLTVALVLALCGTAQIGVAGDGLYSQGMFELGDGNPPPGFPAMADVLEDADQIGPDWGEVFNPDRSPRHDIISGYGGQWALFVPDDISLGTGFESTALVGSNSVINATADAQHDIGNAYVYATSDSSGNLVLYAGAERLGGGTSYFEFEFNREIFRLGHGGFGQGVPWEIVGRQLDGDIRIRVSFTEGAITSMVVDHWVGTGWLPLSDVAGEGCDVDEYACIIANDTIIDGGPWANFDTIDNPEELSAHRFAEFGVNVGALLGSQPEYATVQIRTPQDIAFGYFGEGN